MTEATELAKVRLQARQAWGRLAPRERRLVAAAGTLLLIAALWFAFLQPALRTLREAPPKIDRLDAQLQLMQSLATQSNGLRGATPVPQAQAVAALRSATETLQGKARLTLVGDRATLTLNGIDALSLQRWLTEARSAARARPVEAQLTRSGGGYDGSLVVVFGSAP